MRSRRGEGLFVATPSDVVRTWSVQPAYKLKRTGPQLPSSNITKAVCIKCSGRHLTKDLDVITLLTSCIFICMP
ncbi:hypothetical protein SEVIR_2G165320v4 [Setaria viridis]